MSSEIIFKETVTPKDLVLMGMDTAMVKLMERSKLFPMPTVAFGMMEGSIFDFPFYKSLIASTFYKESGLPQTLRLLKLGPTGQPQAIPDEIFNENEFTDTHIASWIDTGANYRIRSLYHRDDYEIREQQVYHRENNMPAYLLNRSEYGEYGVLRVYEPMFNRDPQTNQGRFEGVIMVTHTHYNDRHLPDVISHQYLKGSILGAIPPEAYRDKDAKVLPVRQYSYDKFDRLICQYNLDSDGDVYSYDQFTWDGHDNLIQHETFVEGALTKSVTAENTYNDEGQLVKIVSFEGDQEGVVLFDASKALAEVTRLNLS